MNDLKFAFRQLLKNPGFTAVAVLTLALGIGANTVVFSVAKAVLFRPLGFEAPDRLMWIRLSNTQTGITEDRLSWREMDDIRESTVDGAALVFTAGLSLMTALVFGLLPALRQSRVEAAESLRSGARTTAGPRIRAWQQGLLVGQTAVVLVLLVSAGLLRLVLLQAGRLVLAGLAIGLAFSLATSRLLASHVFGLSPNDPFLLTAVSVVLLAVALLASFLPARRAAKVNPMEALRHE